MVPSPTVASRSFTVSLNHLTARSVDQGRVLLLPSPAATPAGVEEEEVVYLRR